MKVRRVTADERKELQLGAAIDFIAEIDHMGGKSGQSAYECYLSRDLLRELGAEIGRALGLKGKLIDRFWGELDDIVERLKAGAEAEDDVGKARNAAYFIAIMKNPLSPDIEAVREESWDRWAATHPEEARAELEYS